MIAKMQNRIIGWLFIIAIGFSGYMINFVEGYSLPFLSILIAGIVMAIIFRNKFTLPQIHSSRVLLGLLFIFSGIVKGVDPVGTQYRIIDYFIAYGTEWAFPLALPLSVFMNAAEFILGVMLLLNLKIRLSLWLTLLMMIFFTFTTINDALYNPVPDCGCFGDAIVLSNWQTFYKNLVILSFLMVVFFAQTKISPWFSISNEYLISIIFIVAFVSFEIYNIRHLPLIDFRDWKEGNRMAQKEKLPLQYYLKYQNIETGEEKEFLSPNYPYDDSLWMNQWKFVGQRVLDPNPKTTDLILEDAEGNDVTVDIIENPDFQFMLIAYDLSKTNLSGIDGIRAIADECLQQGYSFVLITSSLPEEVESFLNDQNLSIDYTLADDIILQAMIRSNPGLVLMKDAVVQKKWHFNDIPDFADFESEFVKN